MAEETRKRGIPLPVPKTAITEWAEGLNLKPRGDILLYTGGLYQLIPYINAFVEYLEGMEERAGSTLVLKAARRLKLTGLAGTLARPRRGEVEHSRRVLRAIVGLLGKAGVEVAYNPEVDGYSGVLLYDLGLEDVFKEHAARVYEGIKSMNPQLVVTIDPHTTHVLRNVYPKYIEGYRLNVKSYLEVLAEKRIEPPGRDRGEWVVHDPCLYARSLGIVNEPRRLLAGAGVRVVEAKRAGKMTYCCGGPLESIAPRLSRRIAEKRLEELSSKSHNIVTMCPICYANLSRVARGERIVDVALLLSGEEA